MGQAATPTTRTAPRRNLHTARLAALLAVTSIGAILATLTLQRPSSEVQVATQPRQESFAAASLVPATTTTIEPAQPTIVHDPRPGDLRVLAVADLLPETYEPGKAALAIGNIAYGQDPAQRLDLYLPGIEDAPVILFLHSGGWVAGTRTEIPAMVMRFIERGYAVVSIDYRLAPDHPYPAAIQDTKLAIIWIKELADHSALIDGDAIVLYGTSAGGHIATTAAATAEQFELVGPGNAPLSFDTSVAGVVSVAGPTDLVELYAIPHEWSVGFPEAFLRCSPCSSASLAAASPLTYVNPDVPPAYWAYGAEDTLVEAVTQAEVIAGAWALAAGAESSWIDIVDNAGHNIDHTTINQRAVEEFVDMAVAAARAVTQRS